MARSGKAAASTNTRPALATLSAFPSACLWCAQTVSLPPARWKSGLQREREGGGISCDAMLKKGLGRSSESRCQGNRTFVSCGESRGPPLPAAVACEMGQEFPALNSMLRARARPAASSRREVVLRCAEVLTLRFRPPNRGRSFRRFGKCLRLVNGGGFGHTDEQPNLGLSFSEVNSQRGDVLG